MKKLLLIIALAFLTPLFALAQTNTHQGGTGLIDISAGSIPFGSVPNLRLATSSGLQFSNAASRLTATYASTTALSAATLCLTGDICRTTWPSGGSSASTTLLGDANTFSGVDLFTNSSSNFSGTWQTYSPSHFQVAGSYLTAAITALGPANQTQTGPTQTLATSSAVTVSGLTVGLTIVGSGNTQTFTPTFSGSISGLGTANFSSANISQWTNNAGYLTSLTGAASSTLLSDFNTFTHTITGSITGNAGTATALAANGTNCSAGNYPLGVDASGNAEGCTAAGTGTVTAVTGTWPIVSSGGATPAISYAGFGTTSDTGVGHNLMLYTSNAGVVVGAATSTLNIGGNAGTATALAANGTNCSAGNYPLGVDASGNSENCTAALALSSFSASYPLAYNSGTGAFSSLFSTTTTWGIGNNGLIMTGATGIPFSQATSSPINLNISGNAATVTTNANLSGVVTSSGNVTSYGSQSAGVLGNPVTGNTAVQATSTLYGAVQNGKVLAGLNGSLQYVATSTDSCSTGITCSYSAGQNSFSIANSAITDAMLSSTFVKTLTVTTAQGVSGSFSAGATPALSLTLGALTGVTSFNGLVVTANTGVITTGTWNGTTIALANGGTNATSFGTSGNAVYYDGTRLVTALTTAKVTTPYASTTSATIATEVNLPHSGTVPALTAGDLYINTNSTASSSLALSDGSNTHNLFSVHSFAVTLASSSLAYFGAFGSAASTTLAVANPLHKSTLQSFFCKTDVGTAWVGFGTGAATSTEAQCTSTGVATTLSTNNSWNGRQTVYVEVGHNASSPNLITITADVEDSN